VSVRPFLQYREDVARGILEPGYRRSTAIARDPLRVSLEVRQIVRFELDAARLQLVDRDLYVAYREVEDREGRRLVVWLRIDENPIATANVDLETFGTVRNLETKFVPVKRPCLFDVIDGKARERARFGEKGCVFSSTSQPGCGVFKQLAAI
jgi:hypothetical protein